MEHLRRIEAGVRAGAAEQSSACSRLWANLRDELVAQGVLRDCRSPVPLGPGTERACMQVRVALAARDAEQVEEALAFWDGFGLSHVVAQPRAVLWQLRREEEVEALWRGIASSLAATDRVGLEFWCQEATMRGFPLPEDADTAAQALRFKERAMVADRVKQSRHAASSQTEPDQFDPIAQLDVAVMKAELIRRHVHCQGVVEKEELIKLLRRVREQRGPPPGSSADSHSPQRRSKGEPSSAPRAPSPPPFVPKLSHVAPPDGLPPHSLRAYSSSPPHPPEPAFVPKLGHVMPPDGLPPHSLRAYSSSPPHAPEPSGPRPSSAGAARPRTAAPPGPGTGAESARSSHRRSTAPECRPQSARPRPACAAADAAYAAASHGAGAPEPRPRRVSLGPLEVPRLARPRSPAAHAAPEAPPRPASAARDPWAAHGGVSYRVSPGGAPQRLATPRSTPRGMAANGGSAMEPEPVRPQTRAGSQTPRSPCGSPSKPRSPRPVSPRPHSAEPSRHQAMTPPQRPPRRAQQPQVQSPPTPPASWQQSPPRPGPPLGHSPRPSTAKPPQMPRRSGGDKLMSRPAALACLGLQGNPTAEDLRRAYKEAALRWHPDRQQNHGNSDEAKQRFQEVQAAFELLKPICAAAVAGG